MAKRTPKDSLTDDIINALKQMTGERRKGIDNRYPWESDGEVPLFKARMKYPEPPHFTPEEMRRATGFYDRPGNVSPDEHYAQMETPKGFEPSMIGPPSGEARYFEQQVMPNDPALAGYPTPTIAPGEQEYMDRRRLVTDAAKKPPGEYDWVYNRTYVGDDYGYAKRKMNERDNKGKEAVGLADDIAEIISDSLRYKRKIEK